MGSKPEAIKLLSEEISDNPKNADAYFLYGKVLLEENRDAAYDKFRSAIKADEGMKEKVCDLLKKNVTHPDLVFLNDIDPEIMKKDADLCYKFRVELSPGPYMAVTFADAFPKDPRAPKAIEVEAAAYKRDGGLDSIKAKRLYQRIVREYPKSAEARKARSLLSDWWTKYTISLPVDGKWHSRPVREGQKYRYSIQGEITKETGLGLLRLNGNNVLVFIGSQSELRESQKNTYYPGSYFSDYTGPRAKTAGFSGSGVGPKDCEVWFYMYSTFQMTNTLDVEFEVKE